jgi:hypothetical protein
MWVLLYEYNLKKIVCLHLLIYSITHVFPNFMWVLVYDYKFVLICVHCTYKQCNCKNWFLFILLFIIFFK